MKPEKHGRGAEQAGQMLDLFASLGVQALDLTLTDVDGHKRGFHRALSLVGLRQGMSQLLDAAIQRQQNLILRPRGATVELVQLDDLAGAMLPRLAEAAFMILATSPGNHQAWLAVAQAPAGLARRLRQASAADPNASGATRVAGSINFKRKYAPNFPTVRILQGMPYRTVTGAELQAIGLVAAPEARPMRQQSIRPGSIRRAQAWPSYERCLQNAPLGRDSDRPDVSRADFTFCLLAMDWGWSMAATAQSLMEKSRKARENGAVYARRTVERAAAVLSRRGEYSA